MKTRRAAGVFAIALAGCGGSDVDATPPPNDVASDEGEAVDTSANDAAVADAIDGATDAKPSDGSTVDAGPTTVDWTGGDWERPDFVGKGLWEQTQFPKTPYGFARVTSPVRQGKYAVRIELRPGELAEGSEASRSEVAHAWLETGGELVPKDGDTDFFAFSVRLDTSWKAPTGWGILMQLHSGAGSPPFAFRAMDKFEVLLNGGDTCTDNSFRFVKLADESLNLGKWVDFVLRLKWSGTGKGEVTVWRRNEGAAELAIVANETGVSNMKSCSKTHYWKTGLYRGVSTPHTNILWLDGLNRGKKLEDVVAHAFGK